jgi:hypothetical protein
MDGDGITGDSIGTTTTQFTTTPDTTRGAIRSITATITTEEEAPAAEMSIGRVERTGLLRETTGLPVDTQNPAVKVERGRGRSAATTMVGRQGTIRPVEEPAWAAAEHLAAEVAEEHLAAGVAVAGIPNRGVVVFRAVCKIQNWRVAICGE